MSNVDPAVYRATYSSTEVYECTMNEFPIMRRCKDDWVNATQILKCCNFPKAKRTKILEKGVQQGLHEKIQGGFGRFQGTWIPLADAQKLAAEYGLAPEAAPVLYLDTSDPNIDIPQKAKPIPKEPTPVKRKYTKKIKKLGDTPTKKFKLGGSAQVADHDPFNSQESFSSISRQNSFQSSQQQQQQYLQNPQIFQIPNGKFAPQHHLPPTFQQSEFLGNNVINGNNPAVQLNGNVPNFTAHNQVAQSDFQNYQVQYQLLQQQQAQQQQLQNFQSVPFGSNGQMIPHQPQLVGNFNHPKTSSSQSTNETNWSQDEIIHHSTKDSDTSLSSNEDPNQSVKRNMYGKNNLITGNSRSPPSHSNEEESYSAQLLKFFSEDNAEIPYFVHNPPYGFNINEPIDDEGHTPLHWAASIGNYQMIHLLLSKGASPLVVNNFGLNPLSKSISFNNCYELKNFPKVLDDLELCLINTDINGRTPLHYLCQFAKVKTKIESLKYYLNVILNKLSSLSNQNSSKQIDLLKNVLDHQDVNGDTCLHLAAKSGSSKVVRILLHYGARDDLENIHKETAKLLIMHYNLLPNERVQHNQADLSASEQSFNASASQMQPSLDQQSQMQIHQPIVTTQQLQPSQMKQQSMGQPSSAPNGFTQQTDSSQNGDSNNQFSVMVTPVQPNYNSGKAVETPDTQRTTIQVDDMEEDEVRIDKTHLEKLIKAEDNKENIFMDSPSVSKNYDSMSTPIQKQNRGAAPLIPSSAQQPSQPLTSISERTSESTPLSEERNKAYTNFSVQKAYQPKPPKIDEDGNLINAAEKESVEESKLPMPDLSSMVTGMINSFSDSYNQETARLDSVYKTLQNKIKFQEERNKESLQNFRNVLGKAGIENFETITEGKSLLSSKIGACEEEVEKKEVTLLGKLKFNISSNLVSLIQEKEQKVEGNADSDNNDDLINEEQINHAVELTQLQIQQDNLLKQMAAGIKNYGIDSKMYKYRKLISLSCGLKVEDIDSLIDGIEASLMETVC